MTTLTRHRYIVQDEQILGGEPIIEGTRTPVRVINREEDGFKRLKKIGTQESKGNNLMQLADMICGAVARAYQEDTGAEQDKEEFRRLIQAREEWVRQWPTGEN